MQPIKIPISLCPHIVEGKPRGYYLLAQWLFPKGAPRLVKQQFLGFNGQLLVTVEHDGTWDSLLKIALFVENLNGKRVTWLTKTPIYTMPLGFRAYIPGTILKPISADVAKITTTGVFKKESFGVSKDLYYLEIPKITAGILFGREELK